MRKEDTILVIDMQKVYQPGNPWACAHVNEATQQIETLLDHVLELRDAPSVLLTRYIAPADEDAQGVWADYNRENRAINENPVMNEFIPAIARYVEEFPYIDKCTSWRSAASSRPSSRARMPATASCISPTPVPGWMPTASARYRRSCRD